MKLKHLLIPYLIIIVVFPALIAHLSVPLKLNVPLCENIMDGIMILAAVVGLVSVLIRKKSQFKVDSAGSAAGFGTAAAVLFMENAKPGFL